MAAKVLKIVVRDLEVWNHRHSKVTFSKTLKKYFPIQI